MSETILFTVADGVATITLNRPDKLNAADSHMLHDLLAAVSEAAADDDVRAVLLTGTGRAFCAGQDLADPIVGGENPDLGALLEERWNAVVRGLRSLPKPVVVAVNGTAAGAGANLALSGDVVVAARSARFIQSFAKIALMPDSGGTWVLPRFIGQARAMGVSVFGDPITAEQAEAWGMIWSVVDDDELSEVAESTAADLAAGPTLAYAAIKQAFDAAAANTLDEQLDLERDLQRRLGRSADYAEGVAAFKEKRPPDFTGE